MEAMQLWPNDLPFFNSMVVFHCVEWPDGIFCPATIKIILSHYMPHYVPFDAHSTPIIPMVSQQHCPFGKNRRADLLYHLSLSSLPVLKKGEFQALYHINHPLGIWDIYVSIYVKIQPWKCQCIIICPQKKKKYPLYTHPAHGVSQFAHPIPSRSAAQPGSWSWRPGVVHLLCALLSCATWRHGADLNASTSRKWGRKWSASSENAVEKKHEEKS